jgi:hypothetical protein
LAQVAQSANSKEPIVFVVCAVLVKQALQVVAVLVFILCPSRLCQRFANKNNLARFVIFCNQIGKVFDNNQVTKNSPPKTRQRAFREAPSKMRFQLRAL